MSGEAISWLVAVAVMLVVVAALGAIIGVMQHFSPRRDDPFWGDD